MRRLDLADVSSMYIVLGFKDDGSEPAELSYATLDEAMQKLRDLVEADEIDSDGPMFTEYGIRIDPLPRRHGEDADDDGAAAERAVEPQFQRPRFAPPPPPPHPLKLRRD